MREHLWNKVGKSVVRLFVPLVILCAGIVSPIFFDNPERGEFRILSEENYHDYVLKRSATANPQCKNVVKLEGYDDVSVSESGDEKTFKIDKDKKAPPIQLLLDVCFDNIKLADYFDGNTLKLVEAKHNSASKEIVMDLTADKITVADKFEVGENLKIKLTAKIDGNSFDLRKMKVDMSGTVDINHDKYDFVSKKEKDTEKFLITKFDPKSDSLNLDMTSMMNGIDIDLDGSSFAKESADIDFEKLASVQWGSGCTGFGHFYKDNRFQMLWEARKEVKDTLPFNDIKSKQILILKGDRSGDISAAFVAKFDTSDDSAADVIKSVTIGNVKSFETIMGRQGGKYCFILAKDPMLLVVKDQTDRYEKAIGHCFKDDFDNKVTILKLYGSPQIRQQLEFKKDIAECVAKAPSNVKKPDLSGYPETISAVAVKELIGFKWKFPKDINIPITFYIACKGKLTALYHVDPLLFGTDFQLTDFYYGLSDNSPVISMACKFTPKMPFVPGTNLKLEGVELKYDFEGDDHTIAVEAEIQSEVSDFSTLMRCQNEDNTFEKYRCEIGIPSLTLRDIGKEIFQMKEPNKGVVNYDIILNSGVTDLKLIFYIGETEYCRVRGNFQLLSIEGVVVETINVKSVGYAYGVYFTSINIEAIVQHFTKNTYEVSLPWLTRCEGVLTVSNFQGKKPDEDDEGGNDDDKKDAGDDDKKADDSSSMKRSPRRRRRRSLLKRSKGVYHKNKYLAAKYEKMQQNHHFAKSNLKKSKTRHGSRTSKRSGSTSGGPDDAPNVDTSDIEFETPSFNGVEIKPGFTFSFVWKTPKKIEDCKKNAICEFLVKKLGSAQLTLAGAFYDDKTFSISAELSATISLTEHLTFESASLEVSWGPEMDDRSVAVSCEMVYTDPNSFKDPLKFIGAIEISLGGSLKLQFGMQGMINEPFSIKKFGIGNIAIGMEIAKSETGITLTLMIGCQIHVGDVMNTPQSEFDEKILSLAAYFGLNPKDPWESWLYAEANKLTLGKLGKVFGFEEKIPARFRGDGFPEGFLFSISKKAQKIEPLNKDVEEGLIFQGKFKFFDFEGEANLKLQPLSMTYECDIKLCVINWFGGMLKVTRLDDETKGPYLKLEISPGAFKADINGKLEVLGLTYGAKINIGGSSIYCKVVGSIFPGIFNGYIEVKADFGSAGSDFAGGSIMVGIQTNDAFEKIKKALMEFLGGAKEKAQDACDSADKVISDAESQKTESESETAAMEKSITAWEEKLKLLNEELEAKKQSAQTVAECQSKCDKVCFPFFTWIPDCFKVWGVSCGCPGWDKCYKMIDDIICCGACLLKAVASAFMTWVEETLNKIAIAMASVAKGLTAVVQGVIDAAKKVGELVAKIKDLVMAGLRAIAELILSALNFQIRALEFKATLKPDLDLCLSVGIDVSIFGYDFKSMHEYELCLSSILKSIINMICGNAPKTKEISKLDDQVEEVKGQQEGCAEATSELKDTRKETEDEVDSKTAEKYDDELQEKSKLPYPEMFLFIDGLRKKYNDTFTDKHREYMHRPHKMPAYNIHDERLTRAFQTDAPWVHSNSYDPLSHDYRPTQDDTEKEINKRSYILGETLTPCGRVKRSLGQYSDVTNKIMKSVKNMNDVKTHVKIMKRNHINELTKFYKQTHELGTKYKNMNEQQRSDVYHWYHKIRDGYMSHLANTKRHMIHHSYNALPVLRSQINYGLKKNFNSSFEDFIDEIHGNAVSSYKRSVIPTPEHVKGEEMLHNIKNDLVSIVTSENAPITSYENKLNFVNANIREMSKYAAKCQDA